MARNGYASLVEQRTNGDTKRRKLDDYETPPSQTIQLTQLVKFKGPILEPACGSGRMLNTLRAETGLKVTGFDIKRGTDFLKRAAEWNGDIVTNPPYRDGLADAFTAHALKLATGRVAMLMQSDFTYGQKRAAGLYKIAKPEAIIIIPGRVYFYISSGRQRIKSQFFKHQWIVWPDRKTRERGGYDTKTLWADDPASEFEAA